MQTIILVLLAGLITGCATNYWTRPGSILPVLASESDACYEASLDTGAPSALPGSSGGPRLLPRSAPPPRLWERAPGEAAFERFDEQLRYERCMRAFGWRPARVSAPVL